MGRKIKINEKRDGARRCLHRLFHISALALEDRAKSDPQQPPAMRVGLKLKQRDILYARIESAQVSKVKQKGCLLWQIV